MEMVKRAQKENSQLILAYVLIAVGAFWLLRKIGLYMDMSGTFLHPVFNFFRDIFQSWAGFLFSWQMVLIVVGLIMLAGNRSTGIVLIIIGIVFILPRVFMVPGLSSSFLVPVGLIVVGVALVLKRI